MSLYIAASLLVVVIALAAIIWSVSSLKRDVEPSTEPQSPRVKSIAIVALVILSLGVVAVVVALAMTPPKIEHLMEFSVYCSGATIYVGQERAGEDGVTIAVTGKESFLIRSKERGAAVEMLPALLDTLPPGTRVVDRTLDGKVSDVVPRIRAEGPHDIAALEPIELIRPDGSIDWVLPFAGQFAKEPFCFLVRVRSGGDFRPSPAGGSSGSGGSSRGFLRKSRTRHCHCSAWFHVKAREEGTVAWLDRFDESAKSLAE